MSKINQVMQAPLTIFTIGKILNKHSVRWKVTTLDGEPYQILAMDGYVGWTNLTGFTREQLLEWLGY